MTRTRIAAGALGAVAAVLIGAGPVTANPGGGAPGAVTWSAPVPSVVAVEEASLGLSMTYWSRGPRGPMQSGGAIYVPPGTPPPGGWPVVAYAHGTVGIADHCTFTKEPRLFYLDTLYPTLLRAGYAVVLSDYVGLGTPGTHPYLDGPSQARSMIDAVRAARTLVPELSADWAVVGQSQGGQTALFTAHLAPADAPELRLHGAVATGPPSNLELVAPLLGPWVPELPLRMTTAYFAMIMAGLRATAPELDLDRFLTAEGQRVLSIVENDCVFEADEQVRDVSIGSMLAAPLDDPALLAVVDSMMRVPVAGYTVPLYLGQGVTDRDVPIPLTAKLVTELFAHGTDVEVELFRGDHLATARDSLPATVAFLDRVFGR
ncbi:lipase [Nocardia puris]|uniref:Secretory lipase n=1 Tax=Nocardia puris TaxID=208602 RepID=A0A366DVE1_9NOCA|nr:lipase family protein [Nocardia puris]MBF6210459.1 lipase [Nocardia puris]MBF6367534.1 lipase [Nocardia puris]MBF6457719.1 lipase [Nocardia puris]RBO93885.1 secretory lipase [Nocardia puris]